MGYQVKDMGGHLVFAPPKRGKLCDVPLAPAVADAFRVHLEQFRPWRSASPGSGQTARW